MIRLIALLILGTALASCASGTHKIVDMIPEWAGGLPEGVPPRPGTPEYEVYRKGVDEPAKAARNRKTRKNPTPHNRPPQSAASSFIGGRSAQGSAAASERRTGLPVTFVNYRRARCAPRATHRRWIAGAFPHTRHPLADPASVPPDPHAPPSSSVLIYSPAPAAGVRLSPRPARALPPSSRSRLPVGVLHEPDAISVTPRATSRDRPRSTSSTS